MYFHRCRQIDSTVFERKLESKENLQDFQGNAFENISTPRNHVEAAPTV